MGGHLEQHEWHWTGYAVDFPSEHKLEKWIVRHVGVGSYRNSQDCVFDTHLDGVDWRLGPEKGAAIGVGMRDFVADLALPVVRPAKYVAYTMRPRLRFEKWLNGDDSDVIEVQSKVFATGQIIQGMLPETEGVERLPSPALQWTVPLTMTLGREDAMENGGLPGRIENGNMLVLDEALYRTDALARFGGIGERMDIEIVESRFVDYPQKGVNPIFHPIESLQFSLKVQRPFGLTYDQGVNSKIVQTAIVVTPDGAEGKWVMAQVRMRRLIEPDTLVGTELGGKSGTLRFRLVGDDYVPEDFCVEFNAKMPITSMEVGVYSAVLPVHAIEDHEVRLLCSWHKARWGG